MDEPTKYSCMGEISRHITVVIPARNRAHTLPDTLNSCVTQEGDFEIVVCDNCSEDNTQEVVASFSDPRLRYVQTPRVLSMEANFDHAIAKAREGYVFLLGGDDVLLPGAIKMLQQVIAESGTLSIRPQLVNYYWDNYPDPTHQQLALDLPLTAGWRWFDAGPFLEQVSRNLLQHGTFFQFIPSIYHGCVHTSVLSPSWPPAEPVIRSKMPDMYAGVLAAVRQPRYVVLDRPVSLNAMSGSSNAVPQFLRKNLHAGDGRMFWEEVDYPFEPELVKESSSPDIVLAIPVLLADQYLKVKKLGYDLPSISIRDVVRDTIASARRWESPAQYEATVKVALEMAEMHNLTAEAAAWVKEFPFRTKVRTRRTTYFDANSNTYRVIDLKSLGATGAYSASRIVGDLFRTHDEQAATLASENSCQTRLRLADVSSSSTDFPVWLAVRSLASRLAGRMFGVGCEKLRVDFLRPPSRVTTFETGSLEAVPAAGTYDTVLFVAESGAEFRAVAELLQGLPATGGNVFVITRSPETSWAPFAVEECIPLQCSTEERVLLALRDWIYEQKAGSAKQRLLQWLLRPVQFYLARRLGAEPEKVAPSGWFAMRLARP